MDLLWNIHIFYKPPSVIWPRLSSTPTWNINSVTNLSFWKHCSLHENHTTWRTTSTNTCFQPLLNEYVRHVSTGNIQAKKPKSCPYCHGNSECINHKNALCGLSCLLSPRASFSVIRCPWLLSSQRTGQKMSVGVGRWTFTGNQSGKYLSYWVCKELITE